MKRKVRTSERREEKESGGSKRTKRASRLGLGVAAAAAAVTVGRSGARGYVARRGARRRRERAVGGSIHPSAVFFSPCVARHHSAALDAARSVTSASVSRDLPPPSRKPRSASSRKSSYDAASSSLRFLSVCMVHAFFNCQGIIIIKLSFFFTFLFYSLAFFISVLHLTCKIDVYCHRYRKILQNKICIEDKRDGVKDAGRRKARCIFRIFSNLSRQSTPVLQYSKFVIQSFLETGIFFSAAISSDCLPFGPKRKSIE